ncbi:MAG: ATP-dependent helicase [Lachnospiraceae bacterium]|nr:ATP-dependent helicase [Lachnospiraceae bacterium]
MKLCKEQRSAIEHIEGPMMVIAGPGSGKTTVITERIKYMIESAGVNPADILVITFTKAAAIEMETRFKKMTKGRDYRVRFGTFHSIFFWIIKTAYNLGSNSVLSEDEKRIMVERIITKMGLSYDNKDELVSSVLAQISLVKCDMVDLENYYSKDMPEHEFRQIYRCLEAEMARYGKIDFDNMMVLCYDLLRKRSDILEKCRQIFKYIMVDEFQDSNRIQYEILKLLSKPKNNVFVVGDDDQSVYGFRGARPEIMNSFEKDYEGTKKVFLGQNYRSDQAIILAASRVIEKNNNRFVKKFQGFSEECGAVNIVPVQNENQENEHICESIRKKYMDGIPYENQAVLYRTNIQPRRLIYKLNQYGIPYTIGDTIPNIFDNFLIKNILDYMRIAMGNSDRDVYLRVINKPGRYIKREVFLEDPVDLELIKERVSDKDYVLENLVNFQADMKLVSKMRPYPALNFIRKAIGFDDYVKEYAEYKKLDENEFMEILDEFASMIVDMGSFGELFMFIDDYTMLLAKQAQRRRDKRGVNLMTMHSSKGLEFDIVYIMDCLENVTPYKKAKNIAELEEERRMFYVAMTRAKHELDMYVPESKGSMKQIVSRYVMDALGKNNREL